MGKPKCPVPMVENINLEKYELYEQLEINQNQLIFNEHFKKDTFQFEATNDNKYLIFDRKDVFSKKSRVVDIVEISSDTLKLKFQRRDLSNKYSLREMSHTYVKNSKDSIAY